VDGNSILQEKWHNLFNDVHVIAFDEAFSNRFVEYGEKEKLIEYIFNKVVVFTRETRENFCYTFL